MRRRSTRSVVAAIALGVALGAAGRRRWLGRGRVVGRLRRRAADPVRPHRASAGSSSTRPRRRTPTTGTCSGGIYDSLLRQNADGSYSPGLAKSATVTDPQTIVVELKPNIKFSDGTPLDAEAVKFSIERTIAAEQRRRRCAPSCNEVESDHRRQPDQADDQAQDADRGPVLQPARATARRSWCRPPRCRAARRSTRSRWARARSCSSRTRPEGKAVFKKNPNYFEKNKIKLAGVELDPGDAASRPAGADQLAARRHHQRRAARRASTGTEPAREPAGLKVDVKPSDTTAIYAALCKSKPPFDNLKVRQAINYAVDRDQINQLIYQGTSEPMWAHWTTGERATSTRSSTGYYKYNVKKAKKLLKEAGAENLTFDLYASSTRRHHARRRDHQGADGRGRHHGEPGEHHEHRPGVLHRPEGAVGARSRCGAPASTRSPGTSRRAASATPAATTTRSSTPTSPSSRSSTPAPRSTSRPGRTWTSTS